MIALRIRSRVSFLTVGAAVLCALQTGCLFNSKYERIERRGEPIMPVQFQSDYSRQRFQSVALEETHRNQESSRFTVGIPFLVGLKYQSKPSANAYYNDWVERVDVDQDGVITDQEVAALPRVSHEVPGVWDLESEIVEQEDENGNRVITASLKD